MRYWWNQSAMGSVLFFADRSYLLVTGAKKSSKDDFVCLWLISEFDELNNVEKKD